MRKLLLLALVLLFAGTATAIPVQIEDVSVNPDSTVWMSEPFNITADCSYETSNNSLTVYTENLTWTRGGEQLDYQLSPTDLGFEMYTGENTNYPGFVLHKSDLKPYIEDNGPGTYHFDLRCEDDAGNEDAYSGGSFLVNRLSVTFSDSNDFDGLYTGDEHELFLDVTKRSDTPITDDVSFTVEMDGSTIEPVRAPAYSSSGGWILDIPLPTDPGTHTLTVTATHDGAEASVSRQIEVERAEGLSIASFPRQVDPREADGDAVNVTLELQATQRGEDVPLSAADIDELALAGDDLAFWQDGDSTFTVALPRRDPGTYDLAVSASSGDFSGSAATTVVYPVTVSGEFTDVDGNGIQHELTFDGDRDRSTSGAGTYDVDVAPGAYDIELAFPHRTHRATLEIADATVDADWRDALFYRRYTDSQVPGLRLAGLHAFDIAPRIDRGSARLTMGYDLGNIDDPSALAVFRCGDWNEQQARCTGEWSEVGASIDRVAGTVTVSDAAPGAYAVGTRKRLDPRYSRESGSYLPGRTVTFTGVVEDGDGDPVGDAVVSATVAGTTYTNRSNGNGVFRLAFPAPREAGSHTVDLAVEKDPYRPRESAASITVERPARLSVTAPDEVTVRPNASRNVSVYVENVGFRQLDGIEPDLSEVPFDASMAFDSGPLAVNQSREATLTVTVPPGTEPTTETATVSFAFGDGRAGTTFGVTVEEAGAEASATGQASRSSPLLAVPDVGAAARGAVPDDLPLAPLAAFVLFVQAVVVAAAYARGRGPVEREHVDRAMSHLKADIGEVESAIAGHAPRSRPRDTDGSEREGVMRAVSQLKQEIDKGR